MDKIKKVIVTGSSGMLGQSIIEEFKGEKNFIVYGISRNGINESIKNYNNILIDITNFGLLKKTLDEINPDIIIHCAAMVNIEDCEENNGQAYNLHVKSTEILAAYNSPKTKFIYISTDSVFDGTSGDYSETDIVNPLNFYAKTKLQGEMGALEINPNTIVIRTNIYGFHIPKSRSLAEWAIENLSNYKCINGYEDVYFNPLYVGQLARIIKYLCNEAEYKGILNVGSKEYISKYEFLIFLAKEFNYSERLICKASVNDAGFKALRPKNTTLDTKKLKEIYNQVPDLKAGLLEMGKKYNSIFKRLDSIYREIKKDT